MVTERRGAQPSELDEKPREASVEELQNAVAARDELMAVVGHELRNAMSPLVLLAAHFEAVPATDDMMRAKVAMLTRNLKSLSTILDRLSEVTALREGKLALSFETLDARDVAVDVVAALEPIARAGNAELRLDAKSITGRWDRERLRQIIHHLAHNAIRYAGGVIEIAVRPAGTAVEIVVQDAGPGIPASERERLFDRFDRKGSRARNGGLGVGLWVVKALCHAMGGTVGITETSRGACFIVTLPRG